MKSASLNHVYRLVWSVVHSAWVVASEIVRSKGKSSVRNRTIVAAAFPSLMLSMGVWAAPMGGHVSSGSAQIGQQGNITTIHQNTNQLSINWNSFNIAAHETVDFVQPSALALAVNRIASGDGSQILGHLNANGQVWLLNPNGIVFGSGAQVNVGGLVASTLDSVSSSANGSMVHFTGKSNGAVINQGSLQGRYLALLGSQVNNTGTMQANGGSVALGAGSTVSLTFLDNSLLHMQVDSSILKSLAENGGLIQADGGYVALSAGATKSVVVSVVNNTGVIEARTVKQHQGVIDLLGGMQAGTTQVGGTLDASAPEGGHGGQIETSAHVVNIDSDAIVRTNGLTQQDFGNWLIDPADFTVAATGGNETGAQLTTALGSGSVTILSSSGTTGGSGNININDAVSWSANNLTLTAANNVNVNAVMSATGTASLIGLTH